ncbi:hypothetical protein JXA48_00055 [Candidatus Woesearchaeota archaeon]|nr:hypothetical protein [Candidatus Woesearchaeota archaeon]
MVTAELIKSYLEDFTKQNIQYNSQTICEKQIEEPQTGFMESLNFYHVLLNQNTGITHIKLFNNTDEYKYEDDRPTTKYNQIILITSFDPLKEFPEISSRGVCEFRKEKKNNFKLGVLFNAQLINQIYHTCEFPNYVVKTNSQTNAGTAFWKSLEINANKLYLEGVSINEYHSKSLEAAIKAGYKF